MEFSWGYRSLMWSTLCLLLTYMGSCVATTPQNNYTVTSGDVTCVVMTAAIQLNIPYVGKDKNMTSTVSVPANAVASGLCKPAAGEDTLSLFFNAGWVLAITFSNASASSYQWRKVSLTYTTDPQHFPNISASSDKKVHIQDTVFSAGTMVTTLGSSYSCSETILQLNGSISMNVSALQYRALGKDKSTWFNATGVEVCSKPDVIPDTDIALAVSVGIALGTAIVVVVLMYFAAGRLLSRKTSVDFD